MDANGLNLDYHPSICKQLLPPLRAEHTHYNIILINPKSFIVRHDTELLLELANRLGGRTAGQIVEIILERQNRGDNLKPYNIRLLQIEHLPITQICHKGEDDSPSVDWFKLIR